MKTRLTTTAVCALAALAVAAPAEAKTYKGKTRSGSSISFKANGSKVSNLKTLVPASCISTQSSTPKAGGELFQPPGSFRFGQETKAKQLQPAAMNQGIKATKNYRVTVNRKANGTITGKLHVNFSFLTPGYDIYTSVIWICQGDDRFTVR